MKRIIYLLVLIFTTANCVSAQSKDETTIRRLLEEQRLDWNTGDKEKFMGTYWQSDSLMFIGKSGVTYGWQNTLNNYKKGYPDTAAMGKLQFDILEVKRLSVMYFFAVAFFKISRSIRSRSFSARRRRFSSSTANADGCDFAANARDPSAANCSRHLRSRF